MPDNKNNYNRKPRKQEATQEENFGRHLQPQALDFEEAVLGAVMMDSEALTLVSEILTPESFYDPRNQMIYDAIRQLSIADRPVDMLTVTEKLKSLGTLANVGGPVYIAKLCDTVVGGDVEYYAGIIEQKHLARMLISFSSKVQTMAFDETTDVEELMQTTEADLFQLAQNNKKKDYVQINPILEEASRMLSDASKRDGLSGLTSGFKELDKMTSGWQNSDLIIIAARPAMGKTAFALSMAKNVAIDNEIPTAFFSLEMSNVQLINRVITNAASIPADKLRSGKLLPYEWEQFDISTRRMTNKPLYLDDTPGLSIYELRSKARRLKREHDIKLIMIDYLQLMTANGNGNRFGSRQEEVSTISRSLKGLAKELNIPIIALSQLNRGVEQREGLEGKRPQLSDLRESGAIEQDADIVCFIHRPEYYRIFKTEDGVDLRGKAEIIVAKHRNGAVGDVLLTFQGKFARFEDTDAGLVNELYRDSALNTATDMPIPADDDPFGGGGEDRPF